MQHVKEFRDIIKNLLAEQFSVDAVFNGEFLESVFPVLYIEEHSLAIHCIDLKAKIIEDLHPDFFQLISAQAAAQNIRLIHLWEDVFYQHKKLVLSRIKTLLGGNTTIHGRQCVVSRIDKKTADDFLNQNHLQQSVTARFKYGVFYQQDLVAVATFSSGKVFDKNSPEKRSHELVRFASLPGININGGLSKLIKAFVKDVHPADIMTYADRDWSAGKSYFKLGFTFEKETPPQVFVIHPIKKERYTLHRLPDFIKDGFSDSSKTSEEEFLKSEGYFYICNSGNLKFRLVL